MKQNYNLNVEKTRIENQNKLNLKLDITKKGAEFRTKVYFDSFVYETINQSEKVLEENETVKDTKIDWKDDLKSIKTFQNNISLGRHHYVGTAIAANFQSINYVDPLSGTKMHLLIDIP